MVSEDLQTLLRPQLMVQKIVWAGLTITIGLYLFLAYQMVVLGQTNLSATQLDKNLEIVIYAFAATMGILSLLLRKFLLSDQRLSTKLTQYHTHPERLAVTPRSGPLDTTKLEKVKKLSAKERAILGLAREYFIAMIMSLALTETIAISGFLLTLLSHQITIMLPFVFATLILNLAFFPRFNGFAEDTLNRLRLV
ncbi:MAG: hypothetical protein AB1489_00775 [Acidobacteriota bacterium]